MQPFMLPALEKMGRLALARKGLRSDWVETGLGRMHLYDGKGSGRGPTMVVMHGFGSTATAFGRLLVHLAPHVERLVAPDMIGHGWSDPPRASVTPDALFAATKEGLDRHMKEPFVLYGSSLGGAFSLKYALERPERVRALVLVSPGGAAMAEADLQEVLAHFRMRSNGDTRAFLDKLYHRRPWYSTLLAPEIRRMFDREVILDFLRTTRAEDTLRAEDLARLEVPILLVWGKSERLLPRESLAFFRRALPAHTTFVEPEGMAHCPHLDDPKGLADIVAGFVRGLRPVRDG